MTSRLAGCAVALAVGLSAGAAEAAQITFDGGLAYLHSGGPVTTSNTGSSTDNVDYYEEDSFRLDFIQANAPGTEPFTTHIGNYYNVGNAVIHSHWNSGLDGARRDPQKGAPRGSGFFVPRLSARAE